MRFFVVISTLCLMSSAYASGIQCTAKNTKDKFLFYSTAESQYELLHIKNQNGFDQIISKMNNADFELGKKSEGSFSDVTQVQSQNKKKGTKYTLLPQKGIVSIKSGADGVTKRITNLNCKII